MSRIAVWVALVASIIIALACVAIVLTHGGDDDRVARLENRVSWLERDVLNALDEALSDVERKLGLPEYGLTCSPKIDCPASRLKGILLELKERNNENSHMINKIHLSLHPEHYRPDCENWGYECPPDAKSIWEE